MFRSYGRYPTLALSMPASSSPWRHWPMCSRGAGSRQTTSLRTPFSLPTGAGGRSGDTTNRGLGCDYWSPIAPCRFIAGRGSSEGAGTAQPPDHREQDARGVCGRMEGSATAGRSATDACLCSRGGHCAGGHRIGGADQRQHRWDPVGATGRRTHDIDRCHYLNRRDNHHDGSGGCGGGCDHTRTCGPGRRAVRD